MGSGSSWRSPSAVGPVVRISRSPASVSRPCSVGIEHMVLRVNGESGEVACHQQVGRKSESG
ncbi:hypothetical protein GCM10009665_54340 [Kitasatospora nipponensis]|uniref:Uncharacterized protein n=1 Tax=Kitasatospora nipponensis TaxID=258049 RepID=A0ABN1WQZ5_9ACTN